MTTAAELSARTDCADLRAANEDLQRQNDILTGRVSRLNNALNRWETEGGKKDAEIERLQALVDNYRKGEIDARDLGY